MIKKILFILPLLLLLCIDGSKLLAQQSQLWYSQQFREAERMIRIAEPGQLSDSVNVWGDVGSSGRYIIPRATTLPQLISYAFGPNTLRDSQTNLDWSRMRVEINIQEFNEDSSSTQITKFEYRFEEPFPDGMHNFVVKNHHTISVRIKRKPSFRDYVGVIAPVISAVATTITTAILLRDARKN